MQVTVRITSTKFPAGTVDGDTTYLHLNDFGMDWRGGKPSPVLCTHDSTHMTYGPTDLTSPYSVCIGYRTQALL
ncbi:hypothetical protein TNCV_1932131 [Trichonephila clavipes]|nr:hypothetical protein TNCV_1932131 [Trichonephila clavipes]